MKKCEKCGAMIPDEAKFCPECGAINQGTKTTKSSKKSNKKPLIIILGLIAIIAGTVFAVSKYMLSNNDQNGIKNSQTVLYDHYIYSFGEDTLYQKEADGKFEKPVMKMPQELKGKVVQTYKNLQVYKDKLYAIRQEENDDTREFYIISMNLDGTDYKKEVLPPKLKHRSGESYIGSIEGFSIENDTIYYSYRGNLDLAYSIYKQEIGASKSVNIKFDKEETPVLFGKYAYYIKNEYEEEEGESKIIKRDLETNKETIELSAQETQGTRSSLGVGKDKIVFSAGSSIIWRASEDEGYEIQDVAENADEIYIANMNSKEIIYNANDVYYRLNLKDGNTERLFSSSDVRNDFGAKITSIDQVGKYLAIYGYLDTDETDTFSFFVKEEDGKDYESEIRKNIGLSLSIE